MGKNVVGSVEIGGNITSSNSGIVVSGSITANSNNGYGVYVGGNINTTGTSSKGISVGGNVSAMESSSIGISVGDVSGRYIGI